MSRIRFYQYIPSVKKWKYFESFFLFPSIVTSVANTYRYGEEYYFTRDIGLYWLWFYWGIEWKFGKVKDLK